MFGFLKKKFGKSVDEARPAEQAAEEQTASEVRAEDLAGAPAPQAPAEASVAEAARRDAAEIDATETGRNHDQMAAAEAQANAARNAAQLLLFRDANGRVRGVPLSVIERVEEVPASALFESAGRVQAQIGDEIFAVHTAKLPEAEGSLKLLRLFEALNRLGTTVVVATHDVHLLRKVPDSLIMRLDKGQLADPTGALRYPPRPAKPAPARPDGGRG